MIALIAEVIAFIVAIIVGHEWMRHPSPPLWAHAVFWTAVAVLIVLLVSDLLRARRR